MSGCVPIQVRDGIRTPVPHGGKGGSMKRQHFSGRESQPQFEPLEQRLLLSGVEYLPGLVGPSDLLEHCKGQVVYLDFDGAEGVTYDGPVTVTGIDLPAFSTDQLAPGGRETQVIDKITDLVAAELYQLGVFVTAQVPQVGQYSTVYISGGYNVFFSYGHFDGMAEAVDAGNLNHEDEGFVFAGEISSIQPLGEYVATVASVATHEIGHLLGLSHADQTHDNVTFPPKTVPGRMRVLTT